ncbi:hypothetical protein [Ottowia sp.]|uniref:hypothetical protein n=1 Tax=Ottowia sp. TaxID=1898956 RepID=UPI002C389DCA|nr:hypothetical protein [Ottowia sp.]HOB67735.1 hypothetical protein [Ottowia sp.]HPZ55776.1 hypothetical protein [Ottowia sp.]HQD46393.1 hypothetical protein [Ottowia sp.]
MKRWTACGLLWACAWTAAHGAPAAAPALVHADEVLPTRMVLCQREFGAAERDRKGKMRACLARRLEGERIVERKCKQQAGNVSGAAARAQAQRDCERQALAVPAGELPKRPPPKPKAVPTSNAAPTSTPAIPVAPPAPRPAAGEN